MHIHTDNNGVRVVAIDKALGHKYAVHGPAGELAFIKFQDGPVKDNGVNGLTNEALLAIVTHRLSVLNGEFPCRENEDAIDHVDLALEALEARTKARIARGVGGTHSI